MADTKKDNRKGTLIMAGAPPGYSNFKVLACDYSVARTMENGEPTGAPFLQDYIKLTLETTKNVRFLRDWALSGNDMWGTISMVITAGTKGINNRKMRYVFFGGRVCTMNEYFNSLTSQTMTTTLFIIPFMVDFAEEDKRCVRLLTEKGKVLTDTSSPINITKTPLAIDGITR